MGGFLTWTLGAEVTTEAPESVPVTQPGEPGVRRRRLPSWAWIVVPALVFITIVFVWPVLMMLVRAITTEPAGFSRFQDLVSPGLGRVFLRTALVSALVTVISLAVAYPYAYLAATSGRIGRVLVLVASASLFVSLVVRGYSWLTILDTQGVVRSALDLVGLTGVTFELVHNSTGVVIGMVQYGIPFMVLPLFDVMRRVDVRLMRAGATLGASPRRTFWQIYVPMTLPGITAGCTVVFVASLGYYILPAILGGPQNTMIGEFISNQFLRTGDFGLGATAGFALLVIAVLVYVVLQMSGRALHRGQR
ncbi:MAG: transporter permease [Modestobacter sp.]|nr:transporter permease [Modestobacter sp.]